MGKLRLPSGANAPRNVREFSKSYIDYWHHPASEPLRGSAFALSNRPDFPHPLS